MNETTPVAPRRSWRKRLFQGALFSAVLVAGVAIVQLAPTPQAYAAGLQGAGASGEMRERHRARMREHLQRVLTDAGTSEAQRKKIDAILDGTMDDQHEDMERMHADMQLLKQLLTAPTIDVARVNTVRAEQEQLAVQTTRRLTDAALAIAQQLTPQQRQALGKEIDALFARRHGKHGRGGRGDHDGDKGRHEGE